MRRLILLAALLAGLATPVQSVWSDIPKLNLDDYRGQVVVVDFWASWCVPCRRSFPWLDAMQEQYGDDGLVVIGVNLDSNPDDAEKFLNEYPVDFTIIRDSDGVLARQFEVAAMPTSYVVNRDGQIIARHMGFKVKKIDEYENVIRSAIAGAQE